MGDQFTLNFMVINIMKMNAWISHFIFPLTNKFVNIYLIQINYKNMWILHQYSNWPKRPTAETTHENRPNLLTPKYGRNDPGRNDPAETTHGRNDPDSPTRQSIDYYFSKNHGGKYSLSTRSAIFFAIP